MSHLGSQHTSAIPSPEQAGYFDKVSLRGPSDVAELKVRLADLEFYHSLLREVGVTLPETYFFIREIEGTPRIVVRTKWIEGPTFLDAYRAADESDSFNLLSSLLPQVNKIIQSLFHPTGVGYDVALHNFVIKGDTGEVFAVDITPPRLCSRRNSVGAVVPIEYRNLLVNYPEAPALIPLTYENTLRHLYYTPYGTLEHLFGWCVATRWNGGGDVTTRFWWNNATQDLLAFLSSDLQRTPSGRAVVAQTLLDIESGLLDMFIARRIARERGVQASDVRDGNWAEALSLPPTSAGLP